MSQSTFVQACPEGATAFWISLGSLKCLGQGCTQHACSRFLSVSLSLSLFSVPHFKLPNTMLPISISPDTHPYHKRQLSVCILGSLQNQPNYLVTFLSVVYGSFPPVPVSPGPVVWRVSSSLVLFFHIQLQCLSHQAGSSNHAPCTNSGEQFDNTEPLHRKFQGFHALNRES